MEPLTALEAEAIILHHRPLIVRRVSLVGVALQRRQHPLADSLCCLGSVEDSIPTALRQVRVRELLIHPSSFGAATSIHLVVLSARDREKS